MIGNKIVERLDTLFESRTRLNLTYTFILLFFILGQMLFSKAFQRPVYHDEKHFIEAIELFGNSGYGIWKDYPEVTPPLFYQVYSWWGALFGGSIVSLRLLSWIFGMGFIFFFIKLIRTNTSSPFLSILFLSLILFNPYFLGASVLVYTDIMALFFLVVFLYYWERKLILGWFLAAVFGLLIRQYFVFVLLASGLSLLYSFSTSKKQAKNLIFNGLLLFLSLLPLLLLMFVWGGAAPPSGLSKWDPGEGIRFHFSYLSTYITFLFIYALPLVFFLSNGIVRRDYILFAVGMIWFWIFPIESSLAAKEQMGIETVGITHKTLISVFGNGLFLKIILSVFCGFGFAYVGRLLLELPKLKSGQVYPFSCIMFLMLMPWSYQVWEKYLLMLLPLFFLGLMKVHLVNQATPDG